MVGIFSRLSSKSFHQDGREVLASASEATASVIAPLDLAIAPHGVHISTKFKPVERPFDLLDNDQPVQCPLPDRSLPFSMMEGYGRREYPLLHDGDVIYMLDQTQEDADVGPLLTDQSSCYS